MDTEVIITLDDASLTDLDAASTRLTAAGAQISTVNPVTGTIVAQASAAALDGLRSVRGVLAVETSGTFQIAPPDSPIQ